MFMKKFGNAICNSTNIGKYYGGFSFGDIIYSERLKKCFLQFHCPINERANDKEIF